MTDLTVLVKHELDRLRGVSDTSGQIVIADRVLHIACASNALDVLQRTRTVLMTIDEEVLSGRDTEVPERWTDLFPHWLISSFQAERIEQEKRTFIEWWDQAGQQERHHYSLLNTSWSLRAWLYWFHIDHRTWYWLHADVMGESNFRIGLFCPEGIATIGALEWMLTTAGAIEITDESA